MDNKLKQLINTELYKIMMKTREYTDSTDCNEKEMRDYCIKIMDSLINLNNIACLKNKDKKEN